MNPDIRFGLLGCGAVSKKHAIALSNVDGAELKAVTDIDPEKARATGEVLRVPWYTDPRKMIAEQGLQVLNVVTPSGFHSKNVLELADAGVHFVVEKPMATRLNEADEMIRKCDENGVKIFVVQQNRFNPPIVALRKALAQGRFGKMVMGTVRVRWCRRQAYYDQASWRGTWANDGGVIANQASHHVDMLEWLMGQVDSVMAVSATRLANIEVDDTTAAILKFSSGAIGIIEATTCTRPKDLEGSISILGEGGAVEVGGFAMNELKTWQFESPQPEDETIFQACGACPREFAWNHTKYLEDVVKSLQSRSRGLVEGLDGRRSLELITAIYESAETGKEVHLRFKPTFARLGS